MDKNGKNAGIICLDNNRIRKVIDSFEVLVTVAVHDPTRSMKYNYCIPHYRSGMELLRHALNTQMKRLRDIKHTLTTGSKFGCSSMG
jgi:hypothetical protein